MTDETVNLESLDTEELIGRLEGGLYSLFMGDEQYADLVKVAAALGLKDFVANRMQGRDRAEVLLLFADGEQIISEFLGYAADKGLLELEEDED
ncbi:hypothetical protein [Desulfocurvus sp. DL9XJH121]